MIYCIYIVLYRTVLYCIVFDLQLRPGPLRGGSPAGPRPAPGPALCGLVRGQEWRGGHDHHPLYLPGEVVKGGEG